MSEHDKQLESFFAKKEKGKKAKGKSKFTTSDAITKQVGSTQKETDSRSKDQPSKKTSGMTPTPSNTVEIRAVLRDFDVSPDRLPVITHKINLSRLIESRVIFFFFFFVNLWTKLTLNSCHSYSMTKVFVVRNKLTTSCSCSRSRYI